MVRYRETKHLSILHGYAMVHFMDVYADYSQFMLADKQAVDDVADVWEGVSKFPCLLVKDGVLIVGTINPDTTTVTVNDQSADEGYTLVGNVEVVFPTGELLLYGATDARPQTAAVVVTPGTYTATLFAGPSEPQEHYHLQLVAKQ